MIKLISKIFMFTAVVLSAAIAVFSQCGADGTQPCISVDAKIKAAGKPSTAKPKAPKKTVTKTTPKPVVKTAVKPKNNSAGESIYNSLQLEPQTKTTNENKKSVYDSLKVEPKTGVSNPRPANTSGELFPIFGVTLGKTKEADFVVLDGKRNEFTIDSTKEKGVYYTVNGYDFIIKNGVASSVGLFNTSTVVGNEMPEKWREIGFNWNLSYNQWISLLNRLGYGVTVSQSPKVEDEKGGGKRFTARLIAVKNNGGENIPLRIGLNFLNSTGKTSPDDAGTLFFLSAQAQ
jgi:hypothetical protein